MRLQSPDRAVEAIVNPEISGIFENVDVPAIVVRPGELEDVATNFSSHLTSKWSLPIDIFLLSYQS